MADELAYRDVVVVAVIRDVEDLRVDLVGLPLQVVEHRKGDVSLLKGAHFSGLPDQRIHPSDLLGEVATVVVVGPLDRRAEHRPLAEGQGFSCCQDRVPVSDELAGIADAGAGSCGRHLVDRLLARSSR